MTATPAQAAQRTTPVRRLAGPFVSLAIVACAAMPASLDEQALATQLAHRPAVLLGEVHDNAEQHRIRAAALARLLARGPRPALAFEQFDRDRQQEVDRARREAPANGRSLADHVIARARTPSDGWDWSRYRPFVELALRYDLPIIAANLSRADAARVAREGIGAVFDADQRRQLGLDAIDPDLQRRHEAVVDEGHCRLLPSSALAGLARAQIARDAVLAASIRPHIARGVVLLTGNGHARRDLGVPRHLSPDERAQTWSIGLLEQGAETADQFDIAFITPAATRPDPCAPLRHRGRESERGTRE
jgi:uncharacterized iron-regulated protein